MKLEMRYSNLMLVTGILAGGMMATQAFSQADQNGQPAAAATRTAPISSQPANQQTAPASTPQEIAAKAHNWHVRESTRFRRDWGVDIIGARRISSGEMIEFRYRVLDVNKAKALNDKRSTAYMIDQATGAKLVVPQMEKVGLLRTTAAPQPNRVYWMVFANVGNVVKPGGVVNVNIGNFHADGLIAQ